MIAARIALGALGGLALFVAIGALIWGAARWFALTLDPVAVPFALAGLMVLVAAAFFLIERALAARRMAMMATAATAAAATPGPGMGMGMGMGAMGAAPAELMLVSQIGATRPLTALGIAFSLGIANGIATTPRRDD